MSCTVRTDGGSRSRDQLEPIRPEEAVEMYLAQREPEVSDKTLQNQRYRLDRFLSWCEEEDVEDLSQLTGRDLHRYRVWRGEDVKAVTLRGELRTLQVFLEFCASIDAVPEGLREQVLIPDIAPGDEAKDVHLDGDRAQRILEYLERFEYASRDHVIFALLWHTGIRLGTLRALDVDDISREHRCLYVRHRPETGTPLKNGAAAERALNVSLHYLEVLEDYRTHHRHPTTDEFGREPLLTSEQGRYSAGAIRTTIYQLTLPCRIEHCPHDKDPMTCEWTSGDRAAECPSSRSPHSIRRSAITRMLRKNTPQEVVSDRSNVSPEIIERHYDERSELERAQNRRQHLEDEL